MRLQAMIEQDVDDNLEARTEPSRTIIVEAPAYDDAVAKLREELPDGWRVIWLRDADGR